jgi:hypothetical protein
MEIKTHAFYIELTKTEDYSRECLGKQTSFTVGIYRGRVH